MNRLFTFLLIFFFASSLYSQEGLKIGDWKIYHPYRLGNHITQSEDKVYFTTEWAVVGFDKTDHSPDFLSRVNGLSQAGAKLTKYIPATNSLLITYKNTDFDLVEEGRITTFTNLRTDGNFFNREINDAVLLKENFVYFCTAYGIVEFDAVNKQFGFTANLGINVTGIAWHDGFFFAASEEGIYRAPDDPGVNLKDISNWHLLDVNDGFPGDYESNVIVSYNDDLYMSIDDTLFQYNSEILTPIYQEDGFFIKFLTAEGQHLLLGLRCKDSCPGKMLYLLPGEQVGWAPAKCIDRPRYAIEDQFGQVWFADSWWNFRLAKNINDPCDRISFDAPFSNLVNEIEIVNGEVWTASEVVRSSNFIPPFFDHGFSSFIDGTWRNFNTFSNSVIRENGGKSCYTITLHPETRKVYVGTLWNGLITFDQESGLTEYFSDHNSLLDVSDDPNVTRVSGLAFDQNGHLWMSNNGAPEPIVVWKADGEWWDEWSPALPSPAHFRDIAVDENNFKWFAWDNKGIVVYDDANTVDNPTDDRVKILNTTNSNLPSNRVRSIVVDLDGDVWVGTNKGVIIFDCGSRVFDNDQPCFGFKQTTTQDGIPAYLLETEDVLDMAVDGANRKWFATENGVFVQSPSGREGIARFTKENSLLIDNVVFAIDIDHQTGDVYMGTAKGLVSLRSEAIEGKLFHNESEVFAYPNPVQPDYTGPIAIRGLARNADVKITDVTGQLVYEGQALGGQMIWDGKDYTGRKASSGVYLVFSTSTDILSNPDAIVTKILFMN